MTWETLYEDQAIRHRQHAAVKELHEFLNKASGDLYIILAGQGLFSVYRVGEEGLEDYPVIEEEGRRYAEFKIDCWRITMGPEDLEEVKALKAEGHE